MDLGANGFEVKGNEFSNIVIGEIYLGSDGEDDPFEAALPDTHDNTVEAEQGDRVFDFGVDNDVTVDD